MNNEKIIAKMFDKFISNREPNKIAEAQLDNYKTKIASYPIH